MITKRNIFRNIAEVVRIKGLKTAVAAAIAISLLVPGATARAGVESAIVTIEIPDDLYIIWLDGGAAINLTGDAGVMPLDFIAGEKRVYGGTVQVNANCNYDLVVRANDIYFTGGNGAKPVSDLAVELDANGVFVPLDGANEVVLYTSAAGGGSFNHGFQYKVLLNPTVDVPGMYSTILTYSLRMAL